MSTDCWSVNYIKDGVPLDWKDQFVWRGAAEDSVIRHLEISRGRLLHAKRGAVVHGKPANRRNSERRTDRRHRLQQARPLVDRWRIRNQSPDRGANRRQRIGRRVFQHAHPADGPFVPAECRRALS